MMAESPATNQTQAKEQPTFQRAVKWAYAMSWGEKGINTLFTLVLASILGPQDFGTLAIALVYIAFIQMFLDQGLSAALIQRPNLEPEHLDTVFWVNLIVSLVLVALTVALSNWFGHVVHLPQLAVVISVLSVSLLIEGLTMVQATVLRREMDFKSLSLQSNGSVLVGGVVGLVMALKGFGVWALVSQQVARDLSGLGLLWVVSAWRPRFHFSWKHLRELLGFSVANFMAKLGVFANNQFDALIMGVFFGPVAVGLYRLAERMMTTMLDIMTNSLQAVSFPQFSRLQSHPLELKSSVLSCVWLSSILTVPLVTWLGMNSDVIMALIGPQWVPAANVLTLLCILGIAWAFSPFTGPLLQALSRPGYLAIQHWTFAGIWLVVLAGAGFTLRHSDVGTQILGIAAARLLIGALIFTPILVFVLMKLCHISYREFLRAASPGLMAGLATAAIILTTKYTGLLIHAKPAFSLAVNLTIGGLAAGLTLLAVDSDVRKVFASYFPSSPHDPKVPQKPIRFLRLP